jgi:hypothetical protein
MIGLALGLACAGCADDGGPRLESVSPSAARHDAMVAITGRRLCGPRFLL